jgi:hypothetical protein
MLERIKFPPMRGCQNKNITNLFFFVLVVVGLRLIVEGEASCRWSEGGGRRTTTFTGEQKYLNSVTYLFGSKDGETTEVPVGIHTYNFVCQLPPSIPYSVEGLHGHIRYKVDANLDIPWAFDLHDEKPFTVTRIDDLKPFPEHALPVDMEETKVFCCWWCKSDPLIIKVRLPRSGFGIGEKIPINVEIINQSSKDVLETTFALKRVDRFNATSPEKRQELKETVVYATSRGVKAGETVSFVEYLDIPIILMTSNSRYCKIFQIMYELKFTAETQGMTMSPEVHIPIEIGTVGFDSENRTTGLINSLNPSALRN